MRLLLAGIAALACSGCETVERAAQPVHDFAVAHPVVTAIAVGAGSAALTGYIVARRARSEFEEEARRAEGLQ